MVGKLIILEGGDGSGKATQTKLLQEHLERDGEDILSISFPDYESPSSSLVKMYLEGDFGNAAAAVNPYAASSFFAVDRFASYQVKWKTFLDAGGIVLADRYTTSNMPYQMIKIETASEKEAFLEWLNDFEFHKLGLPEPDLVLYLDVPLSVSEELMAQRQGKTGGQTGDIHEKNIAFMTKCHQAYDDLAVKYNWPRIACTDGQTMRSVEAIHKDVYAKIRAFLDSSK